MKSWCEGPKEILLAAHRLAAEGQPGGRRIALILIDNAVEVMAKTYLSLPKRVTGVTIARKELEGIFESFPALISCLEKNSNDRLKQIDLGEVEWYHQLRNKLYHDGSGLSVEKERVDIYFTLAAQLFQALFDDTIDVKPSNESERLIGSFLSKWVALEKGLIMYSEFVGETYGRTPNLRAGAHLLVEEGKMPREIYDELASLQQLRNAVVHGQVEPSKAIDASVLKRLQTLDQWLRVQCPEYKGA
jgi:hypothetical protein